MWNFKSFSSFLSCFKKLDLSRQLLTSTFFLLIFLYPGHNALQTLIINPSTVHAYTIPSPTQAIYPQADGAVAPSTTAHSVIVQDVLSKTIMYSKKPDSLLMPASITKIMTALVALDYWTDQDVIIEVKNEDRAIGQTIDLVRGERITIKNILYGLLVHSGNDAALALADNYPGGYIAFVDAMNQKSKRLHLENTTFKNPSGVEQYGHLTTARDIAVLALTALQNKTIAEIVNTQRVVVTDVTGKIIHDLSTTNELLGILPGLKGLKTGWTTNAGECLVSYVDRDGKKIVVVVLGSLDRFGDTTRLVNWAYDHHEWITPDL